MSTRTDSPGPKAAAPAAAAEPPVPILALDVPHAEQALALVGRVPAAQWVKVGLQLFTAEGPEVVRALRARGLRVFLDLKLHDIPNTVAHAVRSAAGLGVELLTVHAGGGAAMLRAARQAAGPRGQGPRLFAVTVLTSLDAAALGESWGRPVADVETEAVRLARLAAGAELDGVVCSVHEARAIRAAAGPALALLTPGIRLPGGERHDQVRVATPAEAARRGAAFLVVGRAVAAAPDPAAAWDAVLQDARAGATRAGRRS